MYEPRSSDGSSAVPSRHSRALAPLGAEPRRARAELLQRRAAREQILCATRSSREKERWFSGYGKERAQVLRSVLRRASRRRLMLCATMTGYLSMDLPRFLALVRARRWLIAAIVVAAAWLALVGHSPSRAATGQRRPPVQPTDDRRHDHHRRHDRHRGLTRARGGDESRARVARHRGGERQASVPAVR